MNETGKYDWDEFNDAMEAGLRAMGLAVHLDRRQRLFEHYLLVVEANKQFNLTRITSPANAAVKHYADSLSLLATPWARVEDSREGIPAGEGAGSDFRTSGAGEAGLTREAGARFRVLDVGTGAGYPAVPLAVVCPEWSVTAIDGTGKKVRFVEESAAALGLNNLDAIHARAADLAREGDWRFDLVLVRAVGQMDKILTETMPLFGSHGAVVFYKTANVEQAEMDAAAIVAKRLRLRMETYRVDLPLGGQVLARQLIRYGRY